MIKTYSKDRRKKIEELYASFDKLKKAGFIKEKICNSNNLPIFSYRTKKNGKALWLLAGIHGEEPAGPNALAESIDILIKLGKKHPLVILPLCNPSGYARNWRYPKQEKSKKKAENASVGDSEHYLLNKYFKSRTPHPINFEAGKLTERVLKLAKKYPPIFTVDFHEDDVISKGYIYSQGKEGSKDKFAKDIVNLLRKQIFIKKDEDSRFKEPIINGIIENTRDGSIDELLSSKKIIINKKIVKGPGARTVIVIETPSKAFPLKKRVKAHISVLKYLERADLKM